MVTLMKEALEMRKGQSIVEMAIVLPVLIVLMSLIIDFGYLLFADISLKNATVVAVRRASMNNLSRDQIKTLLAGGATGVAVTASSEAIQITTRAQDPDFPGSPPTVTISVELPFAFGASGVLSASAVTLRSRASSIVTTYPGKATILF